MDKPSQTKPYAGLVIYRIQRNIEYLLINDSFSNKKHWFCPKGPIIGNEEDIKCALRETFETTGLRPSELHIEEGFAIELKYLSGTKPKKVKYYLAQLVNNHVRLLPNAEGVHFQWFNQAIASEKVIYKTMQEVFKHAQTFIGSRQQKKKVSGPSSTMTAYNNSSNNHRTGTTTSTATSGLDQVGSELKSLSIHEENRPLSYNRSRTQQQQQSPQSQSQLQQVLSPLYKTRLCERFETEGSCPYGAKCNFAHGIDELRGKVVHNEHPQQQQQQQQHQYHQQQQNNVQKEDRNIVENQLFKTKLCEKYMRDKFCQYGPKCHFAHGEEELKTRPKTKALEEETIDSRQQQYRPHNRYYNNHSDTLYSNNDNNSLMNDHQRKHQWRTTTSGNKNEYEHNRSNEKASWRSPTLDKVSTATDTTTRLSSSFNRAGPQEGRADRNVSWRNHSTAEDDQTSSFLEDLRRPAFIDHAKRTMNGKERHNSKHNTVDETNEKSWMKIVKLSKEESQQLDEKDSNVQQQAENYTVNSNSHSPVNNLKLAQTETIISELKKFFTLHPPATSNSRLAEDVKEVTRIEMRNDLSKKRLLYILLVSLLEDDDDQHRSLLSILRSRDYLFKTLVKVNADQLLLLKAWDNFVTNRKPVMVSKTGAALSYWYDCEMIEEDVFLEWYDALEKGSLVEQKSAKFIEWLNEPDSSEEE
ncbi:MAG: hypothetical protein EXX96DRAFT_613668 [Benjaminiella poitrasii]|nr:MAG: hypothetical protein EXX96DRAFT_613668 [Benjaminiella poitrasii]